ncbi:MAG: type II toxin-antitoxin system RelE/ParE family toxin [Beijerinckiaceae bacterium]
MPNKIRLSARAQQDVAELHGYLAGYSSTTADAIVADLERVLRLDVASNPEVYGWFYLMGEPVRARLFRISRRTQFWIVYEYSAEVNRVLIHRLWNASRNPQNFEI